MSFVHVGYGNLVNENKVKSIVRPNTQSGKRFLKNAKTKGLYIDAALGRGLRALILLDDGSVMGSAISLRTLVKRFNGNEDNDVTEEDEKAIGRPCEEDDEVSDDEGD